MLKNNTYGALNVMTEPTNFEASEWISSHYGIMVEYAKKVLGSDQFAEDLLHDVYLSVLTREKAGEGHDPDKCRFKENYSVEQWVKALVHLYAKSPMYKRGTKDNEVLVGIGVESDDDIEEMSSGQAAASRAYQNAASYDDLESVDLAVTAREELAYLLTFDENSPVNVKYLLTHLKEIMGKSVGLDRAVFDGLRTIGEDVTEALQDVLEFAKKQPDMYHDMLCEMTA